MVEHLGGAVVDAGVEFGAGRVEAEARTRKPVSGSRGRSHCRVMGWRGGERDFDGADDLGGVVGVDEAGGGGVEAGEDTVQVGWAALALAELLA